MSTEERRLLVAVVKGHRRLESVLEGFVELALPGATVLDARGLGEIVVTEIPVFSGFRSLFKGGLSESYVILSALPLAQVDEAIGLLRDVCGDFAKPDTGIAFTLPIDTFHGPEPG